MPTFHDETVQDRYQREHLSSLERYAAMSPLQIEALDIARHNAEAQRDELLEALRAVMAGSRYYEIRGEADWHEISMPKRDALEKARAAIAKAEAA